MIYGNDRFTAASRYHPCISIMNTLQVIGMVTYNEIINALYVWWVYVGMAGVCGVCEVNDGGGIML